MINLGRYSVIFLLMVGALGLLPAMGHAQSPRGQSIIRDTEIENVLKEWTEPLFKAAQIDPNGVNIILVQSPSINAFVAGGANIFIYTGLIQKTKTPEELIGVMAHELGHISGGHLISTRNAYERASYEMILGTVLGLGAAILSGQGDVASAVLSGSQHFAGRRFLAHSRVNESTADQSALRFMETAGINPTGLQTFFGTLESQELLPTDQQTEYARTHPITSNRIDAVRTKIKQSAYVDTPSPSVWINQHKRMQAKLLGFIQPERVAWTYDERDTSVSSLYARSIAAYRQNKVDESLQLIDELLAQEPKNPYFLELKGQMLVDYGRIAEALPLYQNAVRLIPEAALIRIAYAHALLESDTSKTSAKKALGELQRAARDEPRSRRVFRLMATAHGRLGEELMARLYLAEEAVLRRDFSYATSQAKSIVAEAPASSRVRLKAQDLLEYLDHVPKNKK